MDSQARTPSSVLSLADCLSTISGVEVGQIAGLQCLGERWQQQQEVGRFLVQSVLDAFQRRQQDLAKVLRGFGRELDEFYPQLEASCDRLADLGWTMPMTLTPWTLIELAEPLRSDTEIDRMLADHYIDADSQGLREVESDVLRANELAPWHGLLREAFRAYHSGMHQLPVPALMAVIEGLVTAEASALHRRSTAVRKPAAGCQAQVASKGIQALVWRSACRWLDNMFADADFSDPKPCRINRHWILHGRDAGPWTPVDAVRLFVAIQTIG